MKGATRVLLQVRDAIAHLNPNEVRQDAARPFTIHIFAETPQAYEEVEAYFGSAANFTAARKAQVDSVVQRGFNYSEGTPIRIYDTGMPHGPEDFEFVRGDPTKVVCDVLERHPELRLSLARKIFPFRQEVTKDIIWTVSKENALFSLATAIPSVMPLLSIPWAVGEFASDTAVLTANQIRMAFMLAAASDRTVGFREQRAEIASLFAGAFGWRALARELAGKIPMGGGLIPKAAISFAATYVVGASLERYYRVGYGYTVEERSAMYSQMLERGKEVAASLMRTYGKRKA